MKVKYELCGGRIPQKATEGAAAYDLYTKDRVIIKQGRNVVPIGFKMQIEEGYVANILPRSGFSVKGMEGHEYGYRYDDKLQQKPIIFAESERFNADVIIGTIDSDYRGEVGVIIINNDECDFMIEEGTRIAQMKFSKYESPEVEVGELDETERGEGGFGSTGN